MNDDIELRVRNLFSSAQPQEPPKRTKNRPTILFTLLAILATLILTFQTIAIAPPKLETQTTQIIHYYKVPEQTQSIQPATYTTQIQTEFKCVGCAHFIKKTDHNQRSI